MLITKKIRVNGFLPAGLVLNTFLSSSRLSTREHVFKPQLESENTGGSPVPVPWISVPQASANSALRLEGKFLTPAIVMPLGLDPLGSFVQDRFVGGPEILLTATWFDGEVVYMTGDEIPTLRFNYEGAYPTWYSNYYGITQPDVHVFEREAYLVLPEKTQSHVALYTPSIPGELGCLPVTYRLGDDDPQPAYTGKLVTHHFAIDGGRLHGYYETQTPQTSIPLVTLLPVDESLDVKYVLLPKLPWYQQLAELRSDDRTVMTPSNVRALLRGGDRAFLLLSSDLQVSAQF